MKTIRPLADFEIKDWAKKVRLHNFKGVFMRDELPAVLKEGCYIINLDHSSRAGTHWVALRVEAGHSLYCDSYGLPPPEEVQKAVQQRQYPIIYSVRQIQALNSVMCGYICLYFLHQLQQGRDLEEVCKDFGNSTRENDHFIKKTFQLV